MYINENYSNTEELSTLRNEIIAVLKRYSTEELPAESQQFENRIELMADAIERVVAKAAYAVRKENLEVLYEYEEHYLNLIKEHKDEIKFVSAMQEDLRKERSKFFAETLKEVSNTLQETKLDANVTNGWIIDLVKSYTKSLDLSSDMAKEETMGILGGLKQETKKTINNENVI